MSITGLGEEQQPREKDAKQQQPLIVLSTGIHVALFQNIRTFLTSLFNKRSLYLGRERVVFSFKTRYLIATLSAYGSLDTARASCFRSMAAMPRSFRAPSALPPTGMSLPSEEDTAAYLRRE